MLTEIVLFTFLCSNFVSVVVGILECSFKDSMGVLPAENSIAISIGFLFVNVDTSA